MSPTPRALAGLALWLAAGVAASLAPGLSGAWAIGGGGLGLALALDGLWLWRARLPACERRVPAALPIGGWTDVRLRLENRGRRRLRLRVHDHHPARARARGLPLRVELPAGRGEECGYRLWPETRGRHAFGRVELRLRSRLGLLERHGRVGEAEDVRVYPNFRAAARGSSSTSCASTGRATRCARSTGRRPRACAGRSRASTRTSATSR